ncbi:unnamed protein product [Symbiodinium sp. CCMP2592]|nr:unnamed protein product [Symbiodinium sp. CCMP2592]
MCCKPSSGRLDWQTQSDYWLVFLHEVSAFLQHGDAETFPGPQPQSQHSTVTRSSLAAAAATTTTTTTTSSSTTTAVVRLVTGVADGARPRGSHVLVGEIKVQTAGGAHLAT